MSLATKSLNAVKSNFLGTVIRAGAQLAAQILIMRELGPELVGTFGYVLLLHGLLALIIDQGFGWSLIQGNLDDKKETTIVFSRIMFASAIGMMSVLALSYPIETYLNNPLVGTIFRYSALGYLLIGLFSVSQARLRAELRFREIQISITGAYLAAYLLVGVAMAWAGYGVWALLTAWYVQGILQVVIGHYFSPHSFKLANPFQPTKSGPLGRRVAGINVLNWAVDNSSGVFVGGLGASSLGNFNAASMLARTPALHVVQTLQTILFSTASAIRGDQRRIKHLYLSALAAVSFVVFPAFGYAVTHAELIINLLFGSKWLEAATIFSALALGMIALAISTLSGAILTATGDEKTVFYSQLACLGLMIAGLYTAIDFGLLYVGVAVTIAYMARFLMQVKAIAVRGAIAASEFFDTIRGPLFIAIIMGIPVTLVFTFASGMMVEAFALLFKCLVGLLLFRIFPRFFICSALVDLLVRFAVGRRLAAFLKL
ncbi:MAG: oligosaccharide flippase family protein [Nitrosospira sp.]